MDALVAAIGTYQAAAAFAGLLVLALWETARPFFDFFGGSRRERSVHFARNLVLGAVNAVVIAVVFVGAWVWAAEWAAERGVGLLNVLGLPGWAHLLGAVLLFDAWTYLWHRLNHRIPFLWRLHRVHHADAHMDVSTASRFHIGEIVLSSTLRIGLILALGVHAWELLLYETAMFAIVQFHHANIVLPERVDRALRWVIVTPAMHKVHHSRWRPETDSNYSSMLSIWDRIGRSFRLRERLDEVRLGLDAFDAPEHDTLGGLLRMPLLDVAPDPPTRRPPDAPQPPGP